MVNSLVGKLTKLHYLLNKYNNLIKVCSDKSGNISKGLLQQSRVELNFTKQSIRRYKNDINNLVNTKIYLITYTLDKTLFHARLANMSEGDVNVVLQAFAKTLGKELKILEIKELPTFICDCKL